ncbi:MAG TPA: UbiA family prenyltransferase [Chthonomonadaceae bacterium]|nr:UbiA family prenyltransferase [Chthonomonadaceae bacterium]
MSVGPARWWTYQRERFPIFAHGPLVAAFSFSGVCYSLLLRGQPGPPSGRAVVTAFLTALLFFLQLRIVDEFKDFEEDSRFRPYRAVPRGLVRLRELGAAAAIAAAIQAALAAWLQPAMLLLLLPVWLYLALMGREFFARKWLKSHPFTYMWTHMAIISLIDFYVTNCDWRAASARPPDGLIWFLLVSFFNGIVLEIGRKLRAPQDEEPGVETYTVLWGLRGATGAWLCALALTAAFACLAAARIHFLAPAGWLLAGLLALSGVLDARFLHQPVTKRARAIEAFSAAWTLVMYLSLGAAPWALKRLPRISGLPAPQREWRRTLKLTSRESTDDIHSLARWHRT